MDGVQAIKAYLDSHEMTQADFARGVRKSPSMVWQWLNRHRPISPRNAIAIEEFTKGEVTRYVVSPELYPREAA